MARIVPKDPLIFVLGATGTGKSQVSVQILQLKIIANPSPAGNRPCETI